MNETTKFAILDELDNIVITIDELKEAADFLGRRVDHIREMLNADDEED